MFKIRPYKTEDQAEILNLHHVALEVIGAFKGDGHWDSDLNQIEKVYNGMDSIFLVGEENGRILAMGAFKKSGETVAELKRMRVLPEYQSKGYGRKMYYELENIAKTMGYSKFHLETSVLQIPAQKPTSKR